MSLDAIIDQLQRVSAPALFNPYTDLCPIHDRPDAAAIRSANLLSYLQAVQRSGSDTIWMGRDLGYNGGRRTGLAFTGETDFALLMRLYRGADIRRATIGAAVSERTSTVIWQAIEATPVKPFLWNVLQMHPHEAGKPFSNRKFRPSERAQVDALNDALIRVLGIRRAIGVGADASEYAKRFGIDAHHVRHPSYGGIRDFRSGIAAIYGLTLRDIGPDAQQMPLL